MYFSCVQRYMTEWRRMKWMKMKKGRHTNHDLVRNYRGTDRLSWLRPYHLSASPPLIFFQGSLTWMYWLPCREMLRMCFRESRILMEYLRKKIWSWQTNVNLKWRKLCNHKLLYRVRIYLLVCITLMLGYISKWYNYQFNFSDAKLYRSFTFSKKLTNFSVNPNINHVTGIWLGKSYFTLSMSWMYCCSSQPTRARSFLSSCCSSIAGTQPSKNLMTNMPALEERGNRAF